MKILFIDVNCKQGSTGKIVYDLYTECRKDGYEAAVCYGRGKKIDEPNIVKFAFDAETYFHALMTRLTGFTGCYSFFSTRKLLRFIEEFKPHVVHIHEMHAYFVNLYPVIEYLKKKNIKTIWTFHCEFMYTGKCGHSYECENWKSQCGKCPYIKDYPSSIFWDFTKLMFNEKKIMFKEFNNLIITAPSKWLADRVKQSFLGNKKLVVVHNGIDTESIFYPRNFDHLKEKHNITNEKIVIAVAPDLMSSQKGGRYVAKLAKRMKNDNVKFVFIGIINIEEKFDDNIIAIGRTNNQQELAEYYSMADVFVICSMRENFPTTCIESLACGTPICGFDTGGTKETAPWKLGTFVKYGDLDALKDAVVRTIKEGNLSVKCADYGKNVYSKRRMYENYKNLYFD